MSVQSLMKFNDGLVENTEKYFCYVKKLHDIPLFSWLVATTQRQNFHSLRKITMYSA